MKLRTILISLLLLIISLACVCSGSTPPPVEPEAVTRRPTPVPPAGQLTPEEAVVEVGQAVDALQQLVDIAPFFGGDVLRVTNGGQVLMEIGDEMWLRLFNDSQLDVVSVEAAENTPLDVQIFLEDGGFTGQVTAEGGQAQFETPNGVTVTILGTTFFVGHDTRTNQTIVVNFEGRIMVDDGSSTVTLSPGFMMTAPSGSPEQFRPITLEQFETAIRRSDSPIQSATQLACPPIFNPSLAAIKQEGGFELQWESAGGCGPYTGLLTATYLGENEPYATYDITEPSGILFDETPFRCEGTFTVQYELILVDILDREVTASTTREVTFIC